MNNKDVKILSEAYKKITEGRLGIDMMNAGSLSRDPAKLKSNKIQTLSNKIQTLYDDENINVADSDSLSAFEEYIHKNISAGLELEDSGKWILEMINEFRKDNIKKSTTMEEN